MCGRVSLFSFLVVAVLLTFIQTNSADAIPAFTRQYKTECSTCHTIYPELNEYGEAFLKSAYVYTGKTQAGNEAEAPVAETVGAEGGAQKGKGGQPRKGNEAIWLSGIPEMIPISFTASLNLAYDQHPANGDKLDLSTRALILNAGGAFRDKAGFFISYIPYSQGPFDPSSSNTPLNNASNIQELFFVGRHLFDTPINLKVGRFEPKLSLWKSKNNIIVSTLAPLAYTVGRSLFTVDAPEDGLELNAIIGSRLFVAGGVANRKGQNTKEGYGHISYKFGGADLLGHEPLMDLENESIWDYLAVTVGGYSYYGRNAINNIGNYYYRTGADLDVLYKRLRVRASGVEGWDGNPTYLTTKSALRSVVLASEAEYLFGSQVIGAFRYEYQDDGAGITRRYIPTVAYAPLQNTKLTLEYQYQAAPAVIDRVALLGLMFSF